METTLAFSKHSSSFFSCHKKCRWTSTCIEFFLPVKISGFLVICAVDLWLHHSAATWWIWENVPHELIRLSTDSIIVLCSFHRLRSILSCSSKIREHLDVDGTFQDTKNLKWRRLSCSEDWWFFHHQLLTCVSMNVFRIQSFPNLRSHLGLSLISKICRTFVSVWDLQCS